MKYGVARAVITNKENIMIVKANPHLFSPIGLLYKINKIRYKKYLYQSIYLQIRT